MNTIVDMTTTQGCLAFLLDLRFACRITIRHLDAIYDANRRDCRQARKFRETKNRMLMRRAETLEAEAARRSDAAQALRDLLLQCGRNLMDVAHFIDAAVPQSLLLDLLNVNQADRHRIAPDDGIIAIAYINRLEDSAMYRDRSWEQGPLAQAGMQFMMHELMHNMALQESADEYLFGKGGMFEFLPTYQQNCDGEMVRQPPKLRLADECDLKGEAS
jgi:hypothetical protein